MGTEECAEHALTLRSWRGVRVVLLSWIAMLGFDFFLHGAVLAGLYVEPSPFLLTPMEAFRRIPIGYLSFLIAAVFLVWIVSVQGAHGWRRGLMAGAALGGVMWVSLGLGMYSISTASPQLLAAWAVGQTVEMAYAGAVAGDALKRTSLRRPCLFVLAASVGFVILAVAAQSLGLVPTDQRQS